MTTTTAPARFDVRIYTATDGGGLVGFSDWRATVQGVERLCVRECKWESTVRVVCEALDIDVEGDFVGVAHPADLYARKAASVTDFPSLG